jgi:hypothetical protein
MNLQQLQLTPFFFIAPLLLLLTTGCASITGSKNQPISITAICEAEPIQGANCTVTNDKGVIYVSTPGTAFVSKSTSDLTVSCTKEKVQSNPAIVKSSSNSSIWGNILLGGPIGAAVDAGTGAGFDYPNAVNVTFNSPCFSK